MKKFFGILAAAFIGTGLGLVMWHQVGLIFPSAKNWTGV